MSLSKHFNSKSQIKRRSVVETESIGAQSLSRFFSIRSKRPAQPAPVKASAPALVPVIIIRRGMNV